MDGELPWMAESGRRRLRGALQEIGGNTGGSELTCCRLRASGKERGKGKGEECLLWLRCCCCCRCRAALHHLGLGRVEVGVWARQTRATSGPTAPLQFDTRTHIHPHLQPCYQTSKLILSHIESCPLPITCYCIFFADPVATRPPAPSPRVIAEVSPGTSFPLWEPLLSMIVRHESINYSIQTTRYQAAICTSK
jgi:hypothetical protein